MGAKPKVSEIFRANGKEQNPAVSRQVGRKVPNSDRGASRSSELTPEKPFWDFPLPQGFGPRTISAQALSAG